VKRAGPGFTFRDVRVGVLGPLEVVTDDGPTVLSAPKVRALLALLALRAETPVSTGEVIDALWGDSPPPSARKAVQMYVSSLRRQLPSASISTTTDGYCLRGADVDVRRFERLLQESRRLSGAGDSRAAAVALSQALVLWRGPPMPDLADQPRGAAEAVRLVEQHHAAEEDLADFRLADGDHDAVIPVLEAAVAAEPLRERRWGQLMLALYRAGRQSDALRAYQRIRRLLGEELGISPGTALVELEQSILAQDPGLRRPPSDPGAGSRQPRRTLGPGGSQLPVAANAFVGRESESRAVTASLEQARLVTVVGPGGCGKTRLAIEVANRIGARFADGVALIRLASGDEQTVVSELAAAFAVEAEPDRPLLGTVVAALASRQVLVVLDNCEHVIAAAAYTAETLVSACAQVRVLATSRETLRCPSEHRFSLGPLPTPAAAELFIARAAAARGGPLHSTEMVSVDEICRRLDGLPLALEIAAARTQTFALAELTAHLEENLLALSGLRAIEERHRTLGAAIDWSYQLLGVLHQRLFRRFSVFEGGATLADAQAFSGPVDVALLVEKSLVVRGVGHDFDPPEQARLTMHETVRQFAADMLERAGEGTFAGRDHAELYLALAETAGGQMRGPGQLEAIARLRQERDNLAAAISWGLRQGRFELPARFGRALWWYWFRTGQAAQGRTWIEAALAASPGDAGPDPDPAGEARAAAGYLAWDTDDFEVAAHHATTVLANPYSSLPAQALAQGVLARVYGDRSLFDAAASAAGESEALYRRWGDAWCIAWARRVRASIAFWSGDAEVARAVTVDAMAGFREIGDDWAIVGCVDLLAGIVMDSGDLPGALALAAESVAGHRRFEDWSGTRAALLHLAVVARQGGEGGLARGAATESLALSEDHGYRLGALHAHLILAHLAADAGDRSAVKFHAQSAADLARRPDDPQAGLEDHQARVEAADLLDQAAAIDSGT
jgi:predicted ATPase/DNA-binding SARP family transcriptional activator